MQPSGPVPAPAGVASGSGPHDGAPAAIGIPQSADAALKAWARVLDHLEEQKRISLRGYFQYARVMRWTSNELELGFAADDDSRWAGENAGERASLDEMAKIIGGLGPDLKNLRLSVRMLDASESDKVGARSLMETSREKSTAERTKRETEARAHPITKHVLQTFGAQIKEIKTDV